MFSINSQNSVNKNDKSVLDSLTSREVFIDAGIEHIHKSNNKTKTSKELDFYRKAAFSLSCRL